MFKKDKESKEFFEVFKKPQEQQEIKYESETLQKEQKNPSVIPQIHLKSSKKTVDYEKNKEELGWIKDTRSEKMSQSGTKKTRKMFLNEVIIKQETLIFSALGAVFLSLACFFVGYKIGHNKSLNPEILQESIVQPKLGGEVKSIPQGKNIKAVDLSLKKTPIDMVKKEQNEKWTLRIISYSNTKKHLKKATNLAKAIKNMTGYNTFVAKRGKELFVCSGRFGSKDSNETRKALKEISNLEYEGKKQFASSYPIQIK
ncbi:MAG: hypothetical protein SCARUB_01883 [Candidatus Scalindua rubra]|uniref:Uncharacterized protein n=1 Tax=Candidatus Scalindua rubra TaxID=1872076 RepID=A0A1E3XBL0_9BACT|nr:MAG: hypothetical protein SCARUB_01883 [Candidatus Scalindua rubra]